MPASTPRMRPRFEVDVGRPATAALAAIQEIVESGPCAFRLNLADDFGDLRVPKEEEHFFSPMLMLSVRDGAPNILACRFTPPPNIWTGFMASYALIIFLGIAGAVFGVSQWMLDRPAWWLLAAPVSLALVAFIYGAAFIGQGLGAEQMYRLRHLVDEAVAMARTGSAADDDACRPPTV